jgi:Xaa-Pro aminopeptidase
MESFTTNYYMFRRKIRAEQWTGVRLGTEGKKKSWVLKMYFNGSAFLNSGIDYASFDTVFFKNFKRIPKFKK